MAIVITEAEKLAEIAKEGGINVPENINDFDLDAHIPFVIFMTVQRGEEMPYESAALENAKMIAAIPAEEITTVTIEGLIDRGFKFGPPTIALVNP